MSAWLLNGRFSATELKAILGNHITRVMRGVRASATPSSSPLAWDVVNEAVQGNTLAPEAPVNFSLGFFKPATPWFPAVPNCTSSPPPTSNNQRSQPDRCNRVRVQADSTVAALT